MKKSSCRGFPTTVAGIDRVGTMRDPIDLEHRVVVVEGVVPVMVAKRALRAPRRGGTCR